MSPTEPNRAQNGSDTCRVEPCLQPDHSVSNRTVYSAKSCPNVPLSGCSVLETVSQLRRNRVAPCLDSV